MKKNKSYLVKVYGKFYRSTMNHIELAYLCKYFTENKISFSIYNSKQEGLEFFLLLNILGLAWNGQNLKRVNHVFNGSIRDPGTRKKHILFTVVLVSLLIYVISSCVLGVIL